MIHQHTDLDSSTRGSIHGREEGLGFFVAAGREILNVHKPLSSVNILSNTRKDGIVLWKELDGIAPNHRHTGQVGVQIDKRLVARRDLRVEDGSQLRLCFGLRYHFTDESAHMTLLGTTLLWQLWTAQQQEQNQPEIGQEKDKQQPVRC